MMRLKTWGGAAVCVVLVAAVWLAGRVEPEPGPETVAQATPGPVESGAPVAAPGSERAIFLAAVSAREQIRLDMAPPRPGTRFVFAPNSSQKGDAKREIQIANLTAKALSSLATAHGLSYDELLALVARGDREGWPAP
ncbi:MAG: hypothetical protein VYE68_05965 [Acidobacteriota bacterium]|nr:hypothetical protein [Acidobacteriota bacterium]